MGLDLDSVGAGLELEVVSADLEPGASWSWGELGSYLFGMQAETGSVGVGLVLGQTVSPGPQDQSVGWGYRCHSGSWAHESGLMLGQNGSLGSWEMA